MQSQSELGSYVSPHHECPASVHCPPKNKGNIMKFITSTFHGYIDYATALVLIIAPFVLGLTDITKLYFLILGSAVILVVVFTNNDVDA